MENPFIPHNRFKAPSEECARPENPAVSQSRRTDPRRSGERESRGTRPSGAVRAGPPAAQASVTAGGRDWNTLREQLAVILYRYAQFKGRDVSAKGSLGGFTDAAQVHGFAQDARRCGPSPISAIWQATFRVKGGLLL